MKWFICCVFSFVGLYICVELNYLLKSMALECQAYEYCLNGDDLKFIICDKIRDNICIYMIFTGLVMLYMLSITTYGFYISHKLFKKR